MQPNRADGSHARAFSAGSIAGEGLWSSSSRPALTRALLCSAALVALVLLGAWRVRESRERELERVVRIVADQAASHLASWAQGRFAAVEFFAEAWTHHYDGNPQVFRRDALRLLERLPGLQALNWVDAEGVIRVTVPAKGNERALGRQLRTHPLEDVGESLERAAATGRPTRTTSFVPFFQGGTGYATYWPVRRPDGSVGGFVNAVFRLDRMMEASRVGAQMGGDFRLAISEPGHPAVLPSPVPPAAAEVRARGEDARAPPAGVRSQVGAWPFVQRRSVDLLARPLVLEVAPTPARLALLAPPSDLPILVALLGACVLMGVLAYRILSRQLDLRRLSLATAQADEAILLIGHSGRILYANRAAAEMMGSDSLDGSDVFGLLCGEGAEARLKEVVATLGRGESWRCRYESVRADGSRHHRDASVTPVRDFSGRLGSYVAVIRDITREQELQEELRHSQKMEAVGRLAGGAAHEFNNLLTVIQGYADQLVDELGEKDDLRRTATTIAEAAQRAAEIVGQLLAFSRRQSTAPEALCLNGAIDQMEMVLVGALGRSRRLVKDLGENLPRVRVDPGHLQQVVVNLCMNARDATDEGGTITLRTREEAVGHDRSALRPEVPPGRYVALSVEDDGAGMDEAIRTRMFEPFFTTKEVGRGTGLGLATVYGIVREGGGALRVASEPGRGTTVTVLFPIADAPSEVDAPSEADAAG